LTRGRFGLILERMGVITSKDGTHKDQGNADLLAFVNA
jgi:hypothetical protein